eukprot:Nk52_evm24s2640 gene=Nk52_evmTU24s2640
MRLNSSVFCAVLCLLIVSTAFVCADKETVVVNDDLPDPEEEVLSDGKEEKNDAEKTVEGTELLGSMIVPSAHSVGEPIQVMWKVFNMGKKAAVDVKLYDSKINENDMEFVHGHPNVTIPLLRGGETFEHIMVVKPYFSENINWGPSHIDFYNEDDVDRKHLRKSMASFGGVGQVTSKAPEGNAPDWAMFVVIFGSLVFAPLHMYRKSALMYSSPSAKKAKSM